MNLARHYRTLGLRQGASSRDVKSAYRNLVRQYHPDINPDEAAIEQFIKINDAYTAILEGIHAHEVEAAAKGNRWDQSDSSGLDGRLSNLIQTLENLGLSNFHGAQDDASTAESMGSEPDVAPPLAAKPTAAGRTIEPDYLDSKAAHLESGISSRPLSMQEQSLKQDAYQQLKDLLRQQKFPRAIALVEGLAHRMPKDGEIIQWQAIVYQRWGRRLIDEGQPQKARIYLKKALRTDPNNQSLWREINRDFWQLANLDAQSS